MSTEKTIPTYTPVFENYKHILYEKDGYVANITLNRPEKRNPLDRAVTIPELNDALSVAEWDDDVKVIVFKGAGPAEKWRDGSTTQSKNPAHAGQVYAR
jgi:1,4-dihydroxy-2-naphthoyl-CoA synthase